MYSNILIISDNIYLIQQFNLIISDLGLNKFEFSFAISPFSKLTDFKNKLDITFNICDLKNENHVDEIILTYDLIISLHCKQLFPSKLVNNVKCINVHPGYNPINRGWYPQVFSIINNLPIGATIHEMDEQLDNGLIIARELVSKYSFDTSESLYNRIIDKEIELIKVNLLSIIKGNYDKIIPEEKGNIYYKNDFNKLLKLDLKEEISIGSFIDRLRALSHGDYNNAYFIDELTGEKVFVKIKLQSESDE